MNESDAQDGEHVEYCRAAYCIGPLDHLAPHCPLHYLILDDWQQRNPPHADCGCHPRTT
jgi:hypothetical protein